MAEKASALAPSSENRSPQDEGVGAEAEGVGVKAGAEADTATRHRSAIASAEAPFWAEIRGTPLVRLALSLESSWRDR